MSTPKRQTQLLRQGRIDSIPNGWQLLTVEQACRIRNDLRKPISVEERDKIQGAFPYYGPTGVLDYIDEYLVEGEFALIGEDGDHFLKYDSKTQTLLVRGRFNVNNHAHIIQSTEICSAEWFYNYFMHRDITVFLSRQGAGRYKLNKESLQSLPILVPPILEQEKICSSLAHWSDATDTIEQLVFAKEKKYAWMLSKLACDRSHIRRQIRDIASEVSRRNRDGSVELVISVTNHSGFMLSEDQFERRVASNDLRNYKIALRGQYAYNPSRINVGSIARLDNWEQGALSPMYVVFRVDETKVNTDFFLHWLSSHEAREWIRRSAQGSVRETVSFQDLGAIPLPCPTLECQNEIAKVLNTAQREIKLLKELSHSYRRQKRGLMQKLLSGEWRVRV